MPPLFLNRLFHHQSKKKSKGNSPFPAYDYKTLSKKNLTPLSLSWHFFGSIAGGGICTLINLLAYPGYFWAIYVIVAILYAWLLVKNTVMSKKTWRHQSPNPVGRSFGP
jgi:hypothetical protein